MKIAPCPTGDVPTRVTRGRTPQGSAASRYFAITCCGASLGAVATPDAGSHLRQGDTDPTGIRFPMAIARDFVAKDAAASVR